MKNLLLFSTILFTTAGAFAQLSVKPNGTTDSYIYVKDQILFVEQGIELTANTTAGTEPGIYLRENAQLIQGSSNTNNTGTGFVSVQQNAPETNARAYYYWSSPIGNPAWSGGTPGNRNFGIGSVYQSNGARSAAQVLRTTGLDGSRATNPITVSTRWLYTYPTTGTEQENKYVRMNAGDNAPAGKGFIMKGVGPLPSVDQTYEFRGRPNNGEFTVTVAGPIGPVPQMTLSGNPYASALDLNQLFYDTGNTELGALWYYDEDRSVYSHYYSQKPFGYGTWIPGGPDNVDGDLKDNSPSGTYTLAAFNIYNASGNTGTGPGTFGGNDQNKRYAPIGQGIMFVGATDGVVTIRNTQRIFVKEGAAGSVFQRPDGDATANEGNNAGGPTLSTSTGTTTNVDNRTPGMRLWVIFDDAITRDMVLNFSDLATDGYDRGMDGLSPMDIKTDAYFPVGNDNERLPYVISTINFSADKQVPFAFKLNKQTNIQLRVVEEVKKPYQRAYLFDSQENTYKELTNATASGVTLTLPAGTYDNRFFVVFRSPNVKRDAPITELEAKEAILANVNLFQNNPVQQMEVSNPEGYTINSAMVYDMNGKLVIQEKNLGSNNKYSFYTGNLSDGVYLVKLTTSEDIILDYKVIVHNK